MPSIQTTLQRDPEKIIATLGLDTHTARIEVQCLLQHVLQVPRAYLIAHPEHSLSDVEHAQYTAWLQRRLCGEPIAYILGEREFFGLRLQLNAHTLIPRPETELLVEQALQIISSNACSVLDLGTGSGAIALAIAHHRPYAHVVACDISSAALAVASANAQHLKIQNVNFLQSDWYAELGEQCFDLIVSNPPYIAADDPHLQLGDLRFEPRSALASGTDGLTAISDIIRHSPQHLNSGGMLWLEHGYNQATSVRELLQQAGFKSVHSVCDLANTERISGGTLPNSRQTAKIPDLISQPNKRP